MNFIKKMKKKNGHSFLYKKKRKKKKKLTNQTEIKQQNQTQKITKN